MVTTRTNLNTNRDKKRARLSKANFVSIAALFIVAFASTQVKEATAGGKR